MGALSLIGPRLSSRAPAARADADAEESPARKLARARLSQSLLRLLVTCIILCGPRDALSFRESATRRPPISIRSLIRARARALCVYRTRGARERDRLMVSSSNCLSHRGFSGTLASRYELREQKRDGTVAFEWDLGRTDCSGGISIDLFAECIFTENETL